MFASFFAWDKQNEKRKLKLETVLNICHKLIQREKKDKIAEKRQNKINLIDQNWHEPHEEGWQL